MSNLFFYSLMLSGALLFMWGAYRAVRMRRLVLGRGVLIVLTALAVVAAGLPQMLAEPVRVTVSPESATPTGIVDGIEGAPEAAGLSWWEVLCKVYIVGLAVSLLMMLITIGRIAGIIMRSAPRGHVRLHDNPGLVPFAWGRWVVMSRSDFETHGPMFLAHENAHLRGIHWLDLLGLNLLQCITWYCPAVRLLRGEFMTAHECIADRAVLASGFSSSEYQLLLISSASGRRFANSATVCINYVSLKKRILMMQNQTSTGRLPVRVFALIPAAMLLIALASLPPLTSSASSLLQPEVVTVAPDPTDSSDYYIDGVKADAAQLNDLTPDQIESVTVLRQNTPQTVIIKTKQAGAETSADSKMSDVTVTGVGSVKKDTPAADEKVYDAAEVMPHFPGGEVEMMKYIIENLEYPKEAMDNNIQGRVSVSFVVGKNGEIRDVNVFHGVDKALDAAAVRVVSSFPRWIPGTVNGKPVAVTYNIPINFSLSSGKK